MSKTVWIIHETASTPEVGYAGRHFYIAKYLAKMGYKVYLISSSFSHVYRKPPVFEGEYLVEHIEGFKFIWLKVPTYKNSFDKKRILNWFIFNSKLKTLSNIIKEKPDTIIASSPSPVPSLGAIKLAKKFSAKFIFDVRDIWPLSLMELGGYSKFHPFIMFLQWVEKKAYKSSKYTTSPLEKSIEHMKKHGLSENKFRWIPNGCDFEELSSPEPLSVNVISKIPKDKFIIGYCGTLGVANALNIFVEAALLLNKNSDICFVIVGNGQEKDNLMDMAKNSDNIIFIDAIPKKSVQNVLKLFDVCYSGLKKQELYQFGISLNKIPEYLYASKPLLYSFSGYGNDMLEYEFGFKVDAENANQLANKINEISNMSKEELVRMGRNAKKYALEHYSYEKLAQEFAKLA